MQTVRVHLLTILVLSLIFSGLGFGQASANRPQSAPREEQHDFDFDIGTWKTQLERLLHPLSGSTQWVECNGTTEVRKVWNGRANLVELEVDCPGGHLDGLSLRLHNPNAHQWSLNFSNSGGGTLAQPTIGELAISLGANGKRRSPDPGARTPPVVIIL